MSCVKHECSLCYYQKRNIIVCKWDKCTYQICYRCHYLYGRNKPCPACTRDCAFIKPSPRCIVHVPSRCLVSYSAYYATHIRPCVRWAILYIGVPCCVVQGMAAVGVLLIHIFQLDPCCETYWEFLYKGILSFALFACSLLFLVGLCKHSDDD